MKKVLILQNSSWIEIHSFDPVFIIIIIIIIVIIVIIFIMHNIM